MPKKIQTPEPSSKLVTRYGLVGRLRPMLDETIVPVAVVDDLVESETEVRHAFIADERAPTVGLSNVYGLSVPADAGTVAELHRIEMVSNAISTFRAIVTSTPPALATGLSPQFQDLRSLFLAPNAFPVTVATFDTIAIPAGATVGSWRVLAETNHVSLMSVLIYPGTQWTFVQTTGNQRCAVTFYWKERDLFPDET